MTSVREFEFTTRDFERIRSLVTLHTGISMTEAKQELVYSRLSRRLRQLGISSFDQYCSMVEAGEGGEVTQFVNAITTNLTAFFREGHHFDHLAEKALPSIAAAARSKTIRIWSAGCSTGEEPYSIAMVVKDFLRERRGWDVKILATDIDSNVLETARSGVYPEERIASLPAAVLQTGFRRGVGGNAGFVRVLRELQDMISFRQLNLMDSWPMQHRFDIIFCRNVVIYFSKQNQRILFDRFANALAPGGLLYVGHSESLYNMSSRFELTGKTVYVRRD